MSPVSWALALLPLHALLGGTLDGGPTYEIDVGDVSSAPDACPSQDQVAEALAAHMPGVVARPGREAGPTLLHLGLAVTPEGVARVTMTDATGALRLERDLDVPKSEGPPGAAGRSAPRDRGSACGALADTVALIVERYMRHIGYHEPPPPVLIETKPAAPPPALAPTPPSDEPGARLGLGLSVRPSWRLEPELTAALGFGQLELCASLGATFPIDQPIPMAAAAATFSRTAVSARVALGWTLPLSPRVALVPAVGAGLDLVLAETRGIGETRRSSALEPSAEAGLLARLALTQRAWIAVHAFQGLDLRPEVFYVTTGAPPQTVTLFVTPRTYTRIGVDFGVFLGKNRTLP
jgi:hypothetical protein